MAFLAVEVLIRRQMLLFAVVVDWFILRVALGLTV